MSPRSRRAQTLPMVMTLLGVVAIAGLVFSARYSLDLGSRRDQDLRVQALWLARSAHKAGLTGTHVVSCPQGPALVRVLSQGASTLVEVELHGVMASVRSEPYTERFAVNPLAVDQ